MTEQGGLASGVSRDPSKHRVKVTVLVGALDVGGAELDIVRNFPRLSREEFDVVVVSFGTRGPLGPELERQGIPVIARADSSAIMKTSKKRRIRGAFRLPSFRLRLPSFRLRRAPRARERHEVPWWYRLYSGAVMSIPEPRRQAIKRVLSGDWRRRQRRPARLGPPGWYEFYSRCVMLIPADRRRAIKRLRDKLGLRSKLRVVKRFLLGTWMPPRWRAAIGRFVRLGWLRRDWRGIAGRVVRGARGVAGRVVRGARRVAGRVVRTIAAPFVWIRSEYHKSAPVVWAKRQMSTARYIADVTLWIRHTLIAQNTEIAHFFLPHSYVYGMFATAFTPQRPKTVMSRLSLNFYKKTHWLIAWLERTLLHHLLDIAIGNSTRILDELVQEGVPRRRVRLLYNGIDPEPLLRHPDDRARRRDELGIDQNAFVIVAVGNLHTYKGHRDLIEACSQARDRLPERWQLLIAGRDETGNRAAYEMLVEEIGLGDHVHLLGPCDNVPQLLLAADVFAHPSHHEGLPNAIIEAMAASLPVIGTTVGGLPEAVRPSGDPAETGWLVEPYEPDSLAVALLEAAADPSRRLAMGQRARKRVEAQFSLTHSVATYESIYRELLPKRF